MKNLFFLAKSILITFLICLNSNAAQYSVGTGFFITTDGYFVTNHHVIKNGVELSVRVKDGSSKKAEIIRIDEANDLVLLKVEGKFSAIPISDSREIRKGTNVITIGFPNVDIQGFEPKLSEGIISSLTGLDDTPNVFQISTPIQEGNSGGPLVAPTGNVIGVVASKLNPLYMLEKRGSIPENVNYAIKSNYLLELIRTIPSLDTKLLRPSSRPIKELTNLTAHVEKSIALVIALVKTDDKSLAAGKKQPDPPEDNSVIPEWEKMSGNPDFMAWLRNQPDNLRKLAQSRSFKDRYFLIALFLAQSSKTETNNNEFSMSEKFLLNFLAGSYSGEKNRESIVSKSSCKQRLRITAEGQLNYNSEAIHTATKTESFTNEFKGVVKPGSLNKTKNYYFIEVDGNWSVSNGKTEQSNQRKEQLSLLFNESGIIRIEDARGNDSTCGSGFSRE